MIQHYDVLGGLGLFCGVVFLLVNRGQHTLGSKWFGLAMVCLAASVANLPAGQCKHKEVLLGVLGGLALLSFWVPEKAHLNHRDERESAAPGQLWRQQSQRKSELSAPYRRPYRAEGPEQHWSWEIRARRARVRGERPPPRPEQLTEFQDEPPTGSRKDWR